MSNRFIDVETEYKKNKDLNKADVALIKEWMEKQPHLPKISDLKIAFFLHSCYYKIEATKLCIENFYILRANCPEIFANRRYKDIKEAYEILVQYILPGQTKEGYKVMFVKLLDPNPDKYNFLNYMKAIDTAIMLHFMMSGTSDGDIMLVDMHNLSIGHLLKLNPLIMQKYVFYLQEALHVRIKGIHLTGASSVVDKVISLVKPFLKADIFQVIHVHKSLANLYNFFPKEMLPKEYGGDFISFSEMRANALQMIEQNDDFFEMDDKEVADVSKRTSDIRNLDNLFGTEGSFKSLSID